MRLYGGVTNRREGSTALRDAISIVQLLTMRILIIDQCSGDKSAPDWFEPYTVDDLDEHSYEELIRRDQVPTLPARKLYQGRQQQYISQAIQRLRAAGDTVNRVFISAGFGVVDEETKLPPYDVTFTGLSDSAIQDRAGDLGIQDAILDKIDVSPAHDLVFFALGSDYYEGLDLETILESVPESGFVVLFNQEAVAETNDRTVSIPARTAEANEHGTITVALKGRYIQNFAEHREHEVTIESIQDIVTYCTTDYTPQSGLHEYSSE